MGAVWHRIFTSVKAVTGCLGGCAAPAPAAALLLTILLPAFGAERQPGVNPTGAAHPAAAAASQQTPAASSWPLGYMAAVANPHATAAAAEMLARGGHAVDAAIAAHAVLGLVEPESSGLGGGGFMVVYQRSDRQLRFYDGRETAPAGATVDMFMQDGRELGFFAAKESGLAVGVPGAVALYKLAHDNHGQLPWGDLFQPAVRLAREGFAVTEKMANYLPMLRRLSILDEFPGSAEYFFPDGEPLQAGDLLRNPAYAETLARIAGQGPDGFYRGPLAEAMVAAAAAEPNPGILTVDDMASYRAVEREVICGDWRDLQICSATPPSSGAMQIMLARLYDGLVGTEPSLLQKVQAFVDAQRLAYADRDYFFGDPDQVKVPLHQLLHEDYLHHRATHPVAPAEMPTHGDPGTVLGTDTAAVWATDTTREAAGTTHYSIVDDQGNAVSVTMTVESVFGSARWVAGFLLNNQLTDFARVHDSQRPAPANAVRPRARPRSSMSPTIVLDDDRELFLITGSPGGNSIPAYTAKTILGIVDWNLSLAEAVRFPNIVARGQTVRVETGMTPGPEIVGFLQQAGYRVEASQGENSGLHAILVHEDRLEGAADPRREGTVLSRMPGN